MNQAFPNSQSMAPYAAPQPTNGLAVTLKAKAKAHSLKIDAKSILLMDKTGKVQEPTSETLSLLGSRTHASMRKIRPYTAQQEQDEEHLEPYKRARLIEYAQNEAQRAEQVFVCHYPGCKKEFRNQQFLKAHLAYHESRAKFVCPIQSCGKSFNYRHNLSIHMRVHNNFRPFECP